MTTDQPPPPPPTNPALSPDSQTSDFTEKVVPFQRPSPPQAGKTPDRVAQLLRPRPLNPEGEATSPEAGAARTTEQPAITGYRVLTSAEIELINTLKALEEQALRALDSVEGMFKFQQQMLAGAPDPSELVAWQRANPGRWLALARTHVQLGFMCAVRSVARPR